MNPDRLNIFFDRFPQLRSTLEKLNAAKIPYAIGGSGCLFLLGNERLPDDVDIYLRNEDHDAVDQLFDIVSFIYESPLEHVRNSNVNGDHSIQLTSHLTISAEGKSYDLSLTPDVLEARLQSAHDSLEVFLYPPEDVLLIKALLQRGADVGKHDIEDIEAFRQRYPQLRLDYLQQRIQSLGAQDRVQKIFDV
ncbi:MAG: hypothetical protein AAB429_03130 [Patescibacteria group bacterium]